MKKYALIGMVGLVFAFTDVGKATNVGTNAKQLIVNDDETAIFESFKGQNDVYIIVIEKTSFEFENLEKLLTPPVFLAPEPLSMEKDLLGSYLPFKEKEAPEAKISRQAPV